MPNKTIVALIFFVFALTTVSAPSKAEDGMEGNVTIGGSIIEMKSTDQKGKSAKYDDYTGADEGMHATGGADLTYNKEAFYLNFRAKDVGYDNRNLYLEEGVYGKYKLFLEYDQTPHIISNNSQTIFNGAGTGTLTLPSGWVRGNQTTNMSGALSGNKKDVELRTDRKAYSAGISSSLSDFDFKVSFKKDEKEGTKSIGGVIGNSGGTNRGIILPEPVDYTTDELKASVAYSRDAFQVELGYYLSQFTNGNKSLTWENPYDISAYNDPTVSRISLPPDNTHNKFSLTGGINLPLESRLSFVGEYGIMEQDEDLLPWSNNTATQYNNGTTNTGACGTGGSSLPRCTAETEIDVTHLGLNLSSKPLPKLALGLKYRYYKTENKTPKTAWYYVNNDQGGTGTGSQPTTVAAMTTNFEVLNNLPYDYEQNQAKLDASYMLFSGTTLKLGYDYETIDRDYREIRKTEEKTYRAAVSSMLSSFAVANLNYSFASRHGDDEYSDANVYDEMRPAEYRALFTSTTVSSATYVGANWDNNPLVRKYDIANRERTKYGANVALFPTDTSTFGLYYNYNRDDYSDSVLGLKYRENQNYTLDVTFSPLEIASVYAYATHEDIDSDQTSRTVTGGGAGGAYKGETAVESGNGRTTQWSMMQNTNVDTVGGGVNFGLLEKKLTLGADFSYSESKANTSFTAGSYFNGSSATRFLPVNMPELMTKLRTIGLTAKYQFTNNLKVGVGYQYENYKSDDWQTDNLDPSSDRITDLITLSGSEPDYKSHTGMVFLTYNFGM